MSKAEAMQGYIDEIEAQKFKVVIDNRGGTAVRLFEKRHLHRTLTATQCTLTAPPKFDWTQYG
jgi:hypothetical protein